MTTIKQLLTEEEKKMKTAIGEASPWVKYAKPSANTWLSWPLHAKGQTNDRLFPINLKMGRERAFPYTWKPVMCRFQFITLRTVCVYFIVVMRNKKNCRNRWEHAARGWGRKRWWSWGETDLKRICRLWSPFGIEKLGVEMLIPIASWRKGWRATHHPLSVTSYVHWVMNIKQEPHTLLSKSL